METTKTNKKVKSTASTAKLKKENSLVKKENNRIKREFEMLKSGEYDIKLTAQEIKALRDITADKLLDVENEISDRDIDLKIPTTISIYMKDKKEFYERLFDKLSFNEK